MIEQHLTEEDWLHEGVSKAERAELTAQLIALELEGRVRWAPRDEAAWHPNRTNLLLRVNGAWQRRYSLRAVVRLAAATPAERPYGKWRYR